MTKYEQLLSEYEYLDVQEMAMKNKGLYGDNTIWIKKDLSETEKACIMAEELGHYETSTGDILDQNDQMSKKQEITAHKWAYEKILPIAAIESALFYGCREVWEIADYLNVDEEFLKGALGYYECTGQISYLLFRDWD